MEDEMALRDNLSDDQTIFWFDDGYVFSRIESEFEPGTGNRHDLSDIVALRDWLNERIQEMA